MYFRVVDGEIRRGDKIKFMANGVEREVSTAMFNRSVFLVEYALWATCTRVPNVP